MGSDGSTVETASPYMYTPTQARVLQLYDHYRTCLMNAKYYAHLLQSFKQANLTADIAVALATSSAFAGLAIWKSQIGGNVFTVLLAVSTLIAVLRPVFRISDKIDRCAKLHYGYLELFYAMDALIAQLRGSGVFSDAYQSKAVELADRFRALELDGHAYQSRKKLLKLQDEVEQSIPADQLWLPSE